MKKICLIFFTIFTIFSYNCIVKAICEDEELNEWATKAEGLFTEANEDATVKYGFAYFLSVTPQREDVEIIVKDTNGDSGTAIMYEDVGIYGVGAYTNLEEETYTLEIYGGENSVCPMELLKVTKIVVPRFNRMMKYDVCMDYPEHELCKTFTNATEHMTEDEFNATMNAYVESIEGKKFSFDRILEYLVYAIVPFVLISIYYLIKIGRYKKREEKMA